MIKMIFTENAPKAIGPYSQAVRVGDFMFLTGQIPIDPETNEVVGDNMIEQTQQVMRNIKSILEKEKIGLDNVVKTTIFVKDLNQFSVVNEEYGKFFSNHLPARSTIEVSRLPKNVLIEIEVIAFTQI